MSDPLPNEPPSAEPEWPRVYLLPNLMTAGNLVCGFAAALQMVEAASLMHPLLDQAGVLVTPAGDITDAAVVAKIHWAIMLILGSCVFDMLDGRLARLGGTDSPFGREFDSLADVVSFGVAPALMVYTVVLHQFSNETGMLIASIYLVCGALRLARFNCLAAQNSTAANKEFTGFPIPAAAGLIASLTLFLLWLYEKSTDMRNAAKWVLPPLMVFLAWMMFSKFRYPSFKGIGWRTKRPLPRFLVILLVLIVTAMNYKWMPFVLFFVYLVYGFLRPFLSRKMKQEIEEEDEEGEGGTERRA